MTEQPSRRRDDPPVPDLSCSAWDIPVPTSVNLLVGSVYAVVFNGVKKYARQIMQFLGFNRTATRR